MPYYQVEPWANPPVTRLGSATGLTSYHSTSSHPSGELCPTTFPSPYPLRMMQLEQQLPSQIPTRFGLDISSNIPARSQLPPPVPPPVPMPLPSQVETEVEVVSYLKPGNIYLDLSESPRVIRTAAQTGLGHPLARYLRVPATNPPLPSLTIEHPKIPWSMTAHRSCLNPHCVTVGDVLLRILETMQTPLIDESNRDERLKRSRREPKSRSRLVLLRGKQMFVGLRKDSNGDVWIMESI
ncbi:hypothetical protein K435DRAFT_964402 [Dendrothele bispora CBS 962.96]|uniref:DUF6699 domain-containing protein n=1 Tax=Dendrothele bispora (strain CBS 962.96) TaxID=1314807 RepID=A0A4S8MC55_DENBC|nr:hypothetical protein K435DRAFT_964402 [Dendrothele bispora CBS 962.96]